MKYGIFKSYVELKALPDRLFDIVSGDEGRGHPERIFDSEKEALETLEQYHSSVQKTKGFAGNTFYSCEVYFVAECEKLDEDGDEIIENLYDRDGIKTAPLERNIEILPAEFVVDEKKINGSKIKRHSDWYYFTATLDELKEYYKGAYPDEDIVDSIFDSEEYYMECDLDEEE